MSYLGPPPARTPVTSAQITDASVTAAKLADDSVTTDKVATLTTLATNTINLPAVSGIVEANANFIDMCLVGPSIDGQSWAGAFSNGAVWTSLMLATVETSGSDAQLNIWDLTGSTLASATPLATLTLTGATPTSIAASMGYIIVGTSDQGMHIVAPHDTGAWAEKTEGWPRSLTTSGAPVLTNVDVQLVSAGLKQAPIYDPSTNGPIPCFGISYGTGADTQSLIKDDGNVYDRSGTVASAGLPCFISNGYFFSVVASDRVYRSVSPIDAITADDWSYNDAVQTGSATAPGTGMDAALDIKNGWIVGADADHLIVALEPGTSADLSSATQRSPSAEINRTYNTGFMPAQIVLAALANSATADRSNNSNTLTQNGGGPTAAVVATGAELLGYSAWSGSIYGQRLADADFAVNSGDFSFCVWLKEASNSALEVIVAMINTGTGTPRFNPAVTSAGLLQIEMKDAAASTKTTTGARVIDDAAWHQLWFIYRDDDTAEIWVDGVLDISEASGLSGDFDGAIGTSGIYVGSQNGGSNPLTNGTISLLRFSKSAPSGAQIKKIYEAEAPMFAANAKVLLQSGSTDAVLDAKVDPLSGKVIVTQTDSQEIFDGLAIETERTIASGGSTFEHGLLWGDAVAEINNANLFASTPATDQRQVNEMVRSLSADMPGGVDLSKAKAWGYINGAGTAILASFNVESITDTATGQVTVVYAIPFKTATGVLVTTDGSTQNSSYGSESATSVVLKSRNDAATFADPGSYFFAAFGELENE